MTYLTICVNISQLPVNANLKEWAELNLSRRRRIAAERKKLPIVKAIGIIRQKHLHKCRLYKP